MKKYTLLLVLSACGRETTPSDVQLAGAGLNPEEIGPQTQGYGGLIEYDWIDFAGAQIPLAIAGLASYSPVGPDINDFDAPYAVVYGLGFLMEQDLEQPDALLGTFAAPPPAAGTCQTVYEPFSFVNNVVDAGDALTFSNADGTVGASFDRTPGVYPPDRSSVFTYYFGLEGYRPASMTRRLVGEDAADPRSMTEEIIRPANFGFGETVTLSFPGGVPPLGVTAGSIPLPLAAAGGDPSLTLPNSPVGVMMSWSGPRYDEDGVMVADSGAQSACLQYAPNPETPQSPDDCATIASLGDDRAVDQGQLYTAPWETEEGLTFRWRPAEQDVGDTVSVTVRFLGPVDREDPGFLEGVVPMSATTAMSDRWTHLVDIGRAPAGTELPQPTRPPLACEDEDDVDWRFDDALTDATGALVPSMQGDPSTKLAEVTCTVADVATTDDGYVEFHLTQDMLSDAMAYAQRYGAEGAIFYVSRSTMAEITTPPVRDYAGKRRVTSPVLVVSRAVQIGRFWYDNGGGAE